MGLPHVFPSVFPSVFPMVFPFRRPWSHRRLWSSSGVRRNGRWSWRSQAAGSRTVRRFAADSVARETATGQRGNEVLCHKRPCFVGRFPYIGLTYGRYLQFRILKWPLILWMCMIYLLNMAIFHSFVKRSKQMIRYNTWVSEADLSVELPKRPLKIWR